MLKPGKYHAIYPKYILHKTEFIAARKILADLHPSPSSPSPSPPSLITSRSIIRHIFFSPSLSSRLRTSASCPARIRAGSLFLCFFFFFARRNVPCRVMMTCVSIGCARWLYASAIHGSDLMHVASRVVCACACSAE